MTRNCSYLRVRYISMLEKTLKSVILKAACCNCNVREDTAASVILTNNRLGLHALGHAIEVNNNIKPGRNFN